MRVRDIAAKVGITERATLAIVGDLESEGYLTRERVGRRNRYHVSLTRGLRHPLEERHTIGELVRAVAPVAERPTRRRSAAD